MRLLRAILTTFAAAVLAAGAARAPAAAQTGPIHFSAADSAELVRYRITDEGLARYRQSVRAFVDAAVADTLFLGRFVTPPARLPLTLDEMTARVDEEPELRRAVEGAGLSTREWVVLTNVLIYGYYEHLLRQLTLEGRVRPRGWVSRANRRFVRAHAEEIETMLQEMERLDRVGGAGARTPSPGAG